MKKLLLPVLALVTSGAYAQTYFEEDFSGGIGDWTLVDSDGDGNNWLAGDYDAGDGQGNVAVSQSWLGVPLNPNNWMIAGPFDLSLATGTLALEWVTKAQNQSFADEEYTAYAGTSGDIADLMVSPYSFNEIIGTTGGAYVPRSLDVSALAGESDVYIAFRHHNVSDEERLNIDDIIVRSIPEWDIKMVASSTPPIAASGSLNITGSVKNNGANTITEFDLDWNDGVAHSETITATIESGATYNFTHPTPLVTASGTSYDITICATVVDDAIADNNCTDLTTYAASGEADRLPLIELFTSSTCPPCYSLNYTGFGGPGLISVLEDEHANDPEMAEVAAIKYQVDWPGAGDHAFNADSDSRVSYYGIGGAPTFILDAETAPTNTGSIDAAKEVPSFVDITATHETTGGIITINVDVDPFITVNGATLHIALLDKSYVAGAGPSFSNGETEFHHVLRKLIPTAGTTIATLTDGETYSTSETYDYDFNAGYPLQGSFELHASSKQEVVVFLQGEDGTILNAAISSGKVAGIEDNADNNFDVSLYPNPASDLATLAIKTSETTDVNVEVYNSLGELVYSDSAQNLTEGEYFYSIDVANFSAGMYTVRTLFNNSVQTTKLSVQ